MGTSSYRCQCPCRHRIQIRSLSGWNFDSARVRSLRDFSPMRARIANLSARRHPQGAKNIPQIQFAARRNRGKLFFACCFERVPGSLGHIDEVIELSRTAQPLSAVNHDALAVDVTGLLAYELGGKIGEFLGPAKAFH